MPVLKSPSFPKLPCRRWIGGLLLMLLCLAPTIQPLQAQSDTLPAQPDQSLYLRAYRQAILLNDLDAAKNMLYLALAESPGNAALIDSLAVVYFRMQEFERSIMLGRQLLNASPEDTRLLSMLGFAYTQLGNVRQALEFYEQTYQLTGSAFYLYQVAGLQFQMRRYGECEASLNRLIEMPESMEQEVSFSQKEGPPLRVPLKAAGLYLLGLLFRDQNQPNRARSYLEQSLEVFPEFNLAQKEIQKLEAPERDE